MSSNQPVEDHLPAYRVRPRFEIETNESIDEILNRLKAAVKSKEAHVKAKLHKAYATLYLPEEDQHFWSPQLSLSFEESENGAIISGLYGPRPTVWTAFVFFYSLIGFAILVISIIGFANRSIGNSSSILWLVPILIILFLSLYASSYFGQKLAHDQMLILHRFLEDSTKLDIDAKHPQS